MIDPLVHFAGRTNVNFTQQGGPAKLADLGSVRRPRRQQTVTSSTGELKLDYGKGVLYDQRPGRPGRQRRAARGRADPHWRDLTITSDLPLGHIVAVSLDDQPLATSQTHPAAGDDRGEGHQLPDRAGRAGVKRIISIGQDPWLVKEIRGTVQFTRPDAADFKVTVLDHSGYPSGEISADGPITLRPNVLYYLIEKKSP